jgi:hypothetical protein
MSEQLNTIYQRDPNIVSRNIAGEVILVPIRSNVTEMNNVYTLNETAARFWELTDGEHTLGQIHQQMAEEFEVTPPELQTDLLALVQGLLEVGALMKVSG